MLGSGNIHYSSWIFDKVIAKWTFYVEQFFSANSSYYQNLRVQTLLFFLRLLSFSSLFPFLLSLSFVSMILELPGGTKHTSFDASSLK